MLVGSTDLDKPLLPKQPGAVVKAWCPKCLRVYGRAYIVGMRRHDATTFMAWCQSCLDIAAMTPKQNRREKGGQLFLPLGPAGKVRQAGPVASTPGEQVDKHLP